MLESIKIDRFKSLRDVEVEFGKVNLFIGGNGAGKSNVLEAIGLLSASLYRGVLDSELARKGVRLTPPALMKSAFKGESLPKTLSISALFSDSLSYEIRLSAGESNTHLSFFSEKCVANNEKIFSRSNAGSTILGQTSGRDWRRARSLWDQARPAYDFPANVKAEFDALSRFAIYAPQTEFLRGVRSGTVEEPPIGLHGEGLPNAALTLIIKCNEYREKAKKNGNKNEYKQIQDALDLVWLPGWANQVRVGNVNPQLVSRDSVTMDGNLVYFIDKFMKQTRNTLSAYDSSEGTLFLLFMAVLLAHPEAPTAFALDNVDSALNPALTRSLISTIIKIVDRKCEEGTELGPSQVFLTSHNPTALDAFDLFNDDQRVFVVRRDAKSGHSTITRLKPSEDWDREAWNKAKGNKKLSQLWIDGEIDGALGSSSEAL